MNKIKSTFEITSAKLTLTEQQNQSRVLTFLELYVTFNQDHVCWKFFIRVSKSCLLLTVSPPG